MTIKITLFFPFIETIELSFPNSNFVRSRWRLAPRAEGIFMSHWTLAMLVMKT